MLCGFVQVTIVVQEKQKIYGFIFSIDIVFLFKGDDAIPFMYHEENRNKNKNKNEERRRRRKKEIISKCLQ